MGASEVLDGYETGPADARSAVIWLHGLGADGYDFAPIVPDLGLPASLGVRFVFPHAPRRPVSLNNGFVMRAWYDLRSLDMDERSHDRPGIDASVDVVRRLVTRERARGVPAARVVLAGFSQGGAIATLAGLTHPEPVAGVIALSTYLLFADRIESDRTEASRSVPFFVGHGTGDPVVPLAAGRMLRDRLNALGQPVEWHTYPMPHAVHPQEIEQVGAFLARVLGGGAA